MPTAPPSAPDVAARTLWMRRPRLAGTLGRVVRASRSADLRAALLARAMTFEAARGSMCPISSRGRPAKFERRASKLGCSSVVTASLRASRSLGGQD